MSGGSRIDEARLVADLRALGIEPAMTVVVHSSLSAVGWVEGGAATVVRAVTKAVGEEGTVAMPAATSSLYDPADLPGPPMTESELEAERRATPCFDRLRTPTDLGAIPEAFRTWPGTLRSDHPIESVCARGPLAEEITRSHPMAFSEGPRSPFGRLWENGASILLLGVGFNRCTALHLAETLARRRRVTTFRYPVLEDGRRVWSEYPNVVDDNDTHFPVIGERFLAAGLATGRATRGSVGEADSILCSMPDLVEFAKRYFESEL